MSERHSKRGSGSWQSSLNDLMVIKNGDFPDRKQFISFNGLKLGSGCRKEKIFLKNNTANSSDIIVTSYDLFLLEQSNGLKDCIPQNFDGWICQWCDVNSHGMACWPVPQRSNDLENDSCEWWEWKHDTAITAIPFPFLEKYGDQFIPIRWKRGEVHFLLKNHAVFAATIVSTEGGCGVSQPWYPVRDHVSRFQHVPDGDFATVWAQANSSMIRYWSFFSVHSFVLVAARAFSPGTQLRQRRPLLLTGCPAMLTCEPLRFGYIYMSCWLSNRWGM